MGGIDVARAMGAAFGPGPDQVLFGTVAGVGTSGAFTVDVYLGNSLAGVSPSAATGLPYYSGYTPSVGDAVCILHGQGSSKTSYLVLGTVAGASSGGGSAGLPIGACFTSPFALTVPNCLLLNGSTFSATTYPVLYALNGSSTTLPDWRNVSPMGAGSVVSLGATAGSLTSTALIAHTHAGGSHSHTGGAHTHSHNHAPSVAADFVINAGGGSIYGGGTFGSLDALTDTDMTSGGVVATSSNSATTGSSGSGSSFSILGPVVGVNWFVKAG